ncbi:MAG: hypothetical protein GC159_20065 [Phycisphaera sp.]|nr:hypothetical protein [Phycisphaera sp.]
MAELTLKEQLKEAIEQMPADPSIDEVMDRIALVYKIERSRAQSRAGQGIPHEQAKARMSKWLQ